MAVTEVAIDRITVSEVRPRRPLRDIAELAESIRLVGLLNPVTLNANHSLIAGYHRLEACRFLGWVTIPAQVLSLNDADAELAEIDENLIRHELHYTERGDLLARRKALYEARYPDTRADVAGGKGRHKSATAESAVAGFAADAAKRTGIAERTIRETVQIATKAAPQLKAALRNHDVPKETALQLVRLPAAAQQVAADALHNGAKPKDATRQARAAVPQLPIQTELAPAAIPATIAIANANALPLSDQTVDLIVTSPPYGLEVAYADSDDGASGWLAFMKSWLEEAYRVAKSGGRLALNVPLDTTSGGKRPTYAQAVQAALAAGWGYQWSIIWNEGNVSKSTGRGSVDSPSSPHVIAPVEMIAVFARGEWKRPYRHSDLTHEEWLSWTNGLWQFSGESQAWDKHPAAFPHELPRRLIKLLSFPGETVLDPFLGSGTTTLAAWRLGREAIGFDVSGQYVRSAKRRLEQAVEG